MFLSKYMNNVDKKFRTSVPAGYRHSLNSKNSGGVVVYPSIKNQCIEACSLTRLEKISESIQSLDPYSEERDAFETIMLGGATQLNIDSEGRIVLPKPLVDYAGIDDRVIIIGKGVVFEMWNPDKFEEHLAKAKLIAQNNKNLLKNI